MSGLAVQETQERLEHFLESKKVASLHLGNHQTGTLREVEAPNLRTILLARSLSHVNNEITGHNQVGCARAPWSTGQGLS